MRKALSESMKRSLPSGASGLVAGQEGIYIQGDFEALPALPRRRSKSDR
jgi:hypothetical protein